MISEFSLQIYSLISDYSKGGPFILQNIFKPAFFNAKTMYGEDYSLCQGSTDNQARGIPVLPRHGFC